MYGSALGDRVWNLKVERVDIGLSSFGIEGIGFSFGQPSDGRRPPVFVACCFSDRSPPVFMPAFLLLTSFDFHALSHVVCFEKPEPEGLCEADTG